MLAHLYYLQPATQLCMGYLLLVWIMKLETASTVILSPLQKVGEAVTNKTNFSIP